MKPPELLKEIYQNAKRDIPKEAMPKCKYGEDWAITVYVPVESESYNYILWQIEKHNLSHLVCERTVYTKEELEECRYFSLDLISPVENEGKSVDNYGTQYVNRCINENMTVS